MKARALALVVATALAASRTCAAQQDVPERGTFLPGPDSVRGVGLKDPKLALLLGVVSPGLGHRYAGERGRGRLLFAGSLGPIYVGLLHEFAVEMKGFGCIFSPGCETSSDAEIRHAHRQRNVLVAVGTLVWAYGAWDAPGAARRTNERRVNGRSRLSLSPAIGATPSGARYAGASMRFR